MYQLIILVNKIYENLETQFFDDEEMKQNNKIIKIKSGK